MINKTSATCVAVIVSVLGLSPSALAQTDTQASTRTDTSAELAALFACRSEVDDMTRLACFDAHVGTLRTAEASGDVVVLTKGSIETTRREGFGLDLSGLSRLGRIFGGSGTKPDSLSDTPASDDPLASVETDKDGSVKRVTYAIEKAKPFGYQRLRFTLANGQVWETTESADVRLPRERDGQPNTLVIRKGFAGSFLMRVNGRGNSVRVRRVR